MDEEEYIISSLCVCNVSQLSISTVGRFMYVVRTVEVAFFHKTSSQDKENHSLLLTAALSTVVEQWSLFLRGQGKRPL